MTLPIPIRPMEPRDANPVADLVTQLGYPALPAEVQERIGRLARFAGAIALVAEVNGKVVGGVSAHVIPTIHSSPPAGWLTMLVVDRDHSGQGIGRALVARVEAWVKAEGAAKISVTSGLQRADAHAFYERLGYDRTGVRLTKVFR